MLLHAGWAGLTYVSVRDSCSDDSFAKTSHIIFSSCVNKNLYSLVSNERQKVELALYLVLE
jgi:hypothetical protein